MSQRNVPRHCSRAKTAQTRSINHNSPSPKKMARTTQSKILAISSNPETIMLLLIVGEVWDPEVVSCGCFLTTQHCWTYQRSIGELQLFQFHSTLVNN